MEGVRRHPEEAFSGFGVIPDVAWEIVFKYLRSSELVNTMKTSATVKRLVKIGRRPEYITPNTMDWIIADLSNSDVLNCRLVCKLWKKAIDHVAENSPRKAVDPDYEQQFEDFCTVNLTTVDKISRFMESYPTHNQNHFFGRSVRLENVVSDPSYWLVVIQFLNSCGHHIWNLQLEFCKFDGDEDKWLTGFPLLGDLFRLTPELRKLDFYSTLDHDDKSVNGSFTAVEDNELPQANFVNLEVFQENWQSDDSLIEYFLSNVMDRERIKMLVLRPHVFTNNILFSQLVFLELSLAKPEDALCLKKITSPLKSLIVRYDNPDNDETGVPWLVFGLDLILCSMGSFAFTLRSVFWRVSVELIEVNPAMIPSFPNLRTFHLYHCVGALRNIPSFDVIKEIILVNTWSPMEEGYAAIREAEYSVHHGFASPEDIAIMNNPDNRIGTNSIMEAIQSGGHDLWIRMPSLVKIICGGYSFSRS